MSEDNGNGKYNPEGDWTDEIDYYCYRVVREQITDKNGKKSERNAMCCYRTRMRRRS